MAIITFLTNIQIEGLIPGAVECSGTGPVRIVEMGSTWRVVIVNESQVVGTAVEFPKGQNSVDINIPVAEIEGSQ